MIESKHGQGMELTDTEDKMTDTFKAVILDDILGIMSEEDADILMQRIDKNVSYGDAAWTLVTARAFKAMMPEGYALSALEADDVFVAIAG
jgi:hypothetical protein